MSNGDSDASVNSANDWTNGNYKWLSSVILQFNDHESLLMCRSFSECTWFHCCTRGRHNTTTKNHTFSTDSKTLSMKCWTSSQQCMHGYKRKNQVHLFYEYKLVQPNKTDLKQHIGSRPPQKHHFIIEWRWNLEVDSILKSTWNDP